MPPSTTAASPPAARAKRSAPDEAAQSPASIRPPLKITRVICQILRGQSVEAKTASCQDVFIVRVQADNGLEGVGESDSSPEVVKAIVDAPFSHNVAVGLRHLLIGENPLETER